MRFYKHPVVLFALLVVGITGCKKDKTLDPIATRNDQNYFPVSPGQYRIYDVDSIRFYDVTLTSDTFHFQVKEEVSEALSTEQLSSGESKTWYEVKIYRRADTSEAWEQTGYTMESVSSLSGERIKDNLHFINLSFPVVLNKTWKGNAYLTDSVGSIYDPAWDYKYSAVDTTFDFQTLSYDSCALVTQYDSENAITKDIEREAYSRGIGLVYKYAAHVERQNVDPLTWIPEKGTIMTYRLLDHNY